ncbi:MAG: ATP-binding cassette domain-containing protein, partial [Candidatus Accumulibacter sp.]|nr:ATP-binding cassette domain-containing protein [Accumulibacter sp.]
MHEEPILQVKGLKKYFPVGGGLFRRPNAFVRALDGVSFSVPSGKTLGLVGESGCGKTTVGRCAVRLEKPTAGAVIFDGRDLSRLDNCAFKAVRRNLQLIFQDPFSSLDPRMTAADIIGENFIIHGLGTSAERREWVREIMNMVGLRPDQAMRYPHEFSGGQRQRLCIARAIALRPRMIVADEPVSALDVSIQAQILNLLVELQDNLGLTYLFISHDLSIVRHMCDEVAVMYLGRIVELASSTDLFRFQVHPYTRTLMDAVPESMPGKQHGWATITGDVPSPLHPPSGCAFHPR